MPSVTHESLVDLFRDCPALATELLQRAVGAKFSARSMPRVSSAELVDLDAAEYRADVVIRIDSEGGTPAEAIIVEVQLDRDGAKRYRWPLYEAGVRARLRCPATVLVIAIEARVATWCARPIRLGRSGSVSKPIVIGPDQLPRITDATVAGQHPELVVLLLSSSRVLSTPGRRE